MESFKKLYNADMTRYSGSPSLYLRVFHFLYRKAGTTSFAPLRLMWSAIFHLWANRKGLEIPVNQQIGGGYI